MSGTTLIKVWIQAHDLNCINENSKPSMFWLTEPKYHQNLIELTLPFETVMKWQKATQTKTLLKD